MERIKGKLRMIKNMTPKLVKGEFVFVTSEYPDVDIDLLKRSKATFSEEEGLSLVVDLELARDRGFDISKIMKCITLGVYSDLEGVGLTAAVANALAENNIPCNMIAAYSHDHAFVPSSSAQEAFEILTDLQKHAAINDKIN
jgi:hypothetical protein